MNKANELNRFNSMSEYQSSTVFDADDDQDYQRDLVISIGTKAKF